MRIIRNNNFLIRSRIIERENTATKHFETNKQAGDGKKKTKP